MKNSCYDCDKIEEISRKNEITWKYKNISSEKVLTRCYEVRSRKWTSLGRKKRMVGKATGKNKVHWSNDESLSKVWKVKWKSKTLNFFDEIAVKPNL